LNASSASTTSARPPILGRHFRAKSTVTSYLGRSSAGRRRCGICGAKPAIASSSALRYRFSADRRASSMSTLTPKAQSFVLAVCRTETEISTRHCTPPQVVAYPRTRHRGLRQTPTEAGERRSLHRISPGRSPGVPDEVARQSLATEVVSAIKTPLTRTARSVPPRWFGPHDEHQKLASHPDSDRSHLPNTRHAAGHPITPPLGFGSFRRLNSSDRCIGLPHRRHPLSGFLTLSTV